MTFVVYVTYRLIKNLIILPYQIDMFIFRFALNILQKNKSKKKKKKLNYYFENKL